MIDLKTPVKIFLIILAGVVACFMAIWFIIYMFSYHPPVPPETDKEHFINQCENLSKLPDTHGKDWTCK